MYNPRVVNSICILERRYAHVMEELLVCLVFSLLSSSSAEGRLHALSSRLTHWTKPLRTSLPLTTLADLGKSKFQLIAENALLRQQLIILRRQVKRPTFTRTDRILLVLLARLLRTWQQALMIVQPDTLRRLASLQDVGCAVQHPLDPAT